MTCKDCKTTNPIGSKFCRECGAKMPLPESALAAEEADKVDAERKAEITSRLLGDAFALSEQNKLPEAIALAEEAARTVPDSTTAYSLLASLYERTEQHEKAIHAMERVVALNPQSAADAYKLQLLKRGVHVLPRRVPKKPETSPRGLADWFPVAAASASATLVVIVGILALTRPAADTAPPAGALLAEGGSPGVPPVRPTPEVTPAPINPGPVRDHTPPPATRQDPFVGSSAAKAAAATSAAATPPPNTARVGPLPSIMAGLRNDARPAAPPARDPAVRTVAPAPVTVLATPNTPREQPAGSRADGLPPLAPPPGSGDGSFGGGGRLNVGPPAAGGGSGSEQPGNSPGGGYIRISVGPPSGKSAASGSGNGGGGRTIPAVPPQRGNDDLDGDPLRRAQRLQSLGRYDEAVGAYRDALSSGASAGDAQQGMGMAQQRRGDTSAAKAAYRQAIAAYEAQIAAGKNVSAAKRGLESCKAALEVLGGE